MSVLAATILVVIDLYVLLLIFRFITEMVQAFSRNFRPPSWFFYVAEPIFVVTDPPVKFFRRLIPPLQSGGVGIDLSVLVLFFLLQVIRVVVAQTLG
ncbi:YggT family protein [Corynebacterium uterequi]|uniref:YGGT family protein n=1 Tax=Corynebacterium uterequi TaxID=1072256 RepID=A0A0G3HDK1_9CORY|nr:YggT family protein [Corynebacterium uterequi]AKK11451.1 YGGT family protein [Corynebacterium uterequi]